jgi:hypothetical protein
VDEQDPPALADGAEEGSRALVAGLAEGDEGPEIEDGEEDADPEREPSQKEAPGHADGAAAGLAEVEGEVEGEDRGNEDEEGVEPDGAEVDAAQGEDQVACAGGAVIGHGPGPGDGGREERPEDEDDPEDLEGGDGREEWRAGEDEEDVAGDEAPEVVPDVPEPLLEGCEIERHLAIDTGEESMLWALA